jgi:rhamnosyltransferase
MKTSRQDVCAVVVTYHPDREFPDRMRRILPQVGALVIVDNGSNDTAVETLRELAANPSITLHLNPNNLGVARALNIGVQHAGTHGFTWALLLDQDTCVDEDMIRTLFEVYAAFPHRERVAVIGSGFLDVEASRGVEASHGGGEASRGVEASHGGVEASHGGGEESRGASHDQNADPWEEAEAVITSGSLIPLAAYAAIGPFRDEFFIDYVDSEYCYRARRKGYRVIKTRRPIMSHAIGAPTRHGLLWMSKWTTNHSPDRRYYIARNDTVMLREYGNYRSGLWALKSLSRCVRRCKRIVLYEEMKVSKIMAVVQGWWDGVRGHMGPRAHA